jgi:hypothetical protein
MIGFKIPAFFSMALYYPHLAQDVRMKDIQNEIIIANNTFIIHIYGLHHYKGKLSKFSSEYIIFSASFNNTYIHSTFYLVLRCLKHVCCYRTNSVPYAGFQVLKVFRWSWLRRQCSSHYPIRKTPMRLNLATQGAKQLVHVCRSNLSAISLSRWFLTWWQKCGGAPSFLEDSLRW